MKAQGSRSKIVHFEGCIESTAGVAALASAAVATASLLIRIETPLDLSPLLGKYTHLRVCTPVIHTSIQAMPLPVHPPPHLTLLGPFFRGRKAVVQTVRIFAPDNLRYDAISLINYRPTPGELFALTLDLSLAGIRTRFSEDMSSVSKHEISLNVGHLPHTDRIRLLQNKLVSEETSSSLFQAREMENLENMQARFWNAFGAFQLAPKFMAFIVDHCSPGKEKFKNFHEYLQALRHRALPKDEYEEWLHFAAPSVDDSSKWPFMSTSSLYNVLMALVRVREESDVVAEEPFALKPLSTNISRKDVSVQTNIIEEMSSVTDAAKIIPVIRSGTVMSAQTRNIDVDEEEEAQTMDSPSRQKILRNVTVEANDVSQLINAANLVNDIANDVAHKYSAMSNPLNFNKIISAVITMVIHAGVLCLLPESEINYQISHLKARFCQDGLENTVSNWCAFIAESRRETARRQWLREVPCVEWIFGVRVKQHALCHSTKLKPMHPKNRNDISYKDMFRCFGRVIVVSGVAGAGKSTLLTSIVQDFCKQQLHGTKSDYLQEFGYLLRIDARDLQSKTLGESVLFTLTGKSDPSEAIDCLRALLRLDTLFLVDNVDEANDISGAALLELIDKIWLGNSRVVVTCHPSSVAWLTNTLTEHQTSFAEYTILPLTKLREKLRFLEKYGQCVCFIGNDPPNMSEVSSRKIPETQKCSTSQKTPPHPTFPETELSRASSTAQLVKSCFRALPKDVRAGFTEPMFLVLFWHFVWHRPSKAENWKSFADVTNDMLLLFSATAAEENIRTSSCCQQSESLSLLSDLGARALSLLRSERTSFSVGHLPQSEFEVVDHLTNRITADMICSGVLRNTCIFNCTRMGPNHHCFPHVSLTEHLAARHVLHRLSESGASLIDILEGSPTDNGRYLGMLPLLMEDMAKMRPNLLEERWPELRDALHAGGATYQHWQELMWRCGDVLCVVRHAAQLTYEAGGDWDLETGRHVAIARQMLPHVCPPTLRVWMSPQELREAQWQDLLQRHEGKLELSLMFRGNSCPDDDLLAPLLNAKCQLTWFSGCLSSEVSIEALSSVAASAQLEITLQRPLDLSPLSGKCSWVCVRTGIFSSDWTAPAVAPPSDTMAEAVARLPISLWVRGATQGSCQAVLQTILFLSTAAGNRLEQLVLVSPTLEERELQQLLLCLWQVRLRAGPCRNPTEDFMEVRSGDPTSVLKRVNTEVHTEDTQGSPTEGPIESPTENAMGLPSHYDRTGSLVWLFINSQPPKDHEGE
ncbi:uncharacterized protein LOC108668466 [Hyalella azteca]|uniref:Uncharacterized protein LOC108668466 n=1 Tax=Hyalella azteca TaxID=294128 RepID=A0A8B7NC53_HYAAZ|nr:uncharacterized protein LOC108668466 [Hyalella azteca]